MLQAMSRIWELRECINCSRFMPNINLVWRSNKRLKNPFQSVVCYRQHNLQTNLRQRVLKLVGWVSILLAIWHPDAYSAQNVIKTWLPPGSLREQGVILQNKKTVKQISPYGSINKHGNVAILQSVDRWWKVISMCYFLCHSQAGKAAERWVLALVIILIGLLAW